MKKVSIKNRKPGEKVIVQTVGQLYELTIVDPEMGIVTVFGTDPRLKIPTRAKFLGSDYNGARDPDICQAWKIELQFTNVVLQSTQVVAVRVEGDGWYYEAI